MRRRTRGFRVLVAAVGTTLALGLGTASASAAVSGSEQGTAGRDTAAIPCPSGFVCLVSTDGRVRVSVSEGASASFSPPVKAAAVTNNTSIWYCVGGPVNRAVAPGDTLIGIDGVIVSRLTPSPSGACLT